MHKLQRLIASLGVIAILSTLVVSTAYAALPSDVPADEWYTPFVQELIDAGAVDASAKFNPSSKTTRGEWVKWQVIFNGLESEMPSEATFKDVPKDDPYFEYVETAYAHGVVNGYKDAAGKLTGYFGPNDPVTREQAAKIIVESQALPIVEDSGIFPDEAGLSDWFVDANYASTIYAWSVMVGDSSTGKFRGGDNINHAEAAKVITIEPVLMDEYVSGDDVVDDDVPPVEDDDVVAEAGELKVSLGEVIEAATLPDGATSVKMLNIDVTAGEGGATLKSLELHRFGVSALPTSHALYLYEGGDRLTSGKGINSSTNLAIFGNLSLDVAAGETRHLTVRMDVGSVATTGEIGLEVESEESVGAGESTVVLDGEVVGEKFGLSTTDAGILTIEKNGTITNPKVGEDDVTVAKFKMDAATESASIEEVGLLVTGTISGDNIQNFELYVAGTEEPIATVESLNSNDIAALVLETPYALAKGETKSFTVKADFNTGRSGDTVQIYVDQTTDVVSIGGTFGFGMAVDINNASGYDGTTAACTSSAGTCSYSVLEGGDVTVTSSGPVATDVAIAGKDVHLIDFSITSVSDLTIKNWPIHLVTGSAAAGATGLLTLAGAANYTDIKVINVDTGETLMGPIDATAMYTTAYATAISDGAATDNDGYYLFTDEFDMEVGEELNLALTMDVANVAALNAETVYAQIELGGTYPQMKDVNNKTITNSSSLVPTSTLTGKTMTIASPSLALSLAAVPVGGSNTKVKGQDNIKFLGISAKCGTASTCKVTDIALTGYIDDDNNGTFQAGAQTVAGDATSHASALSSYVGSVWLEDGDGNIVATSKSVNNTSGAVTFDNLAWELEGTEILYVVGKLSTNSFANSDAERISFAIANAGMSYEDADGNTRTSTGAVNGTTSPTTYVTSSEGGSLTVAVDASTAKEDIMVAGSSDNTIGKIKFTTTDEAFLVKSFSVNARQNNAGAAADVADGVLGGYDNNVQSVKISYLNSLGETETKTGYMTSGSAQFSGLDMLIDKDDDEVVTVSATLNTISGGATAGEFVDLNIGFNNFEAIAQSGGSTYKAGKIDATVGAGSDLDFGSITWTDSAADVDGAIAAAVALDATATLTYDNGAGVDSGVTFPIGTLLCTDTAATACSADEIWVVTSATTDAAADDSVTIALVDNNAADVTSTASYADGDNVLYALPGTGYLTGSNQMVVYEAKPEVKLASNSKAAGLYTVAASDNIAAFEVKELGNKEKLQVRASSDYATCVAGTGSTLTSAVNTAISVDGSGCDFTAFAAGDSMLYANTENLSTYAYVSFWFRWHDDGAAAITVNPADIGVTTADLNDGTEDNTQAVAASNVAGSPSYFVEDTWYFVRDVAMPTGTDATDLFIGLYLITLDDIVDADDFYLDRFSAYNEKMEFALGADADFDRTYDQSTTIAKAPVVAYLKEGGNTVATGYVDVLAVDANADGAEDATDGSSAVVTFVPTSTQGNIEISKNTSKTFTIQLSTDSLLAEDAAAEDPLTVSLTLGSSSGGTVTTVTAGGLTWYETNATVRWLGHVADSVLYGNSVRY